MRRGYLIRQARAFAALERSGEPMTVAAVECALGCGRRTAHRWLAEYRLELRALRVAT
jgi:hypothetical protein